MDFIQLNDRLESIGEDVIGWWAKAGWQPGLREKLHMNDLFDEVEDDELPTKDSGNSSEETDSDTQDGEPSKNIPDQAALATTPRITEQPRMSHAPGSSQTVPSFLAYIHPVQENAPIIRRVDTAKLLLSVSLQLAKLPSMEESGPDSSRRFAHAKKVTYAEGVKPRTTITRPDCLVADNVTVEEKSAIKESVIGANCQINEGAKLLQCLLMDGVVVGKSCKLTRCILGKRCVIGDGSILTDCEVQENLMVEPGSKSTCQSTS
jgi:translation initiation factor eIF-2B subunit gamma